MCILQEGRIRRTLIGMIHSSAITSSVSTSMQLPQIFSLPVSRLNVKPELWRHSSCSVTFIPAKLGLLFLGNIPPHQPLPQEQCHAHTQFGCRHEKQGIIHSIWNLSGRNWSGCWRNFTANSLSKLNYGYHHSSNRTHAHPQGPTTISRMTIAYFPLSLPNSISETSAKNEN